MKFPFTYRKFKKIYSKVPRLSVDLVIKTEAGVLLTKRDTIPYMGAWHIPGSTVYHNEPVIEAARRVAKEELGIGIKAIKLIGYIEYVSVQNETPFDWPVALVFEAKVASGSPMPGRQSIEVGYFTDTPLPDIPEQTTFLKAHRYYQ